MISNLNPILHCYLNALFDEEEYPLQKETYKIIGVGLDVHRVLGKGFSEIVYKDALEYKFNKKGISFEREKEFLIQYKEKILPHKFYADFVVQSKIILEVKCSTTIIEKHYAQVINYLTISKLQVGLILNFSEKSLEYKRVILKS